jgi:hypothetical protein
VDGSGIFGKGDLMKQTVIANVQSRLHMIATTLAIT